MSFLTRPLSSRSFRHVSAKTRRSARVSLPSVAGRPRCRCPRSPAPGSPLALPATLLGGFAPRPVPFLRPLCGQAIGALPHLVRRGLCLGRCRRTPYPGFSCRGAMEISRFSWFRDVALLTSRLRNPWLLKIFHILVHFRWSSLAGVFLKLVINLSVFMKR